MKLNLFTIISLLLLPLFSYSQWSDNSDLNVLLSGELNQAVLPKIALCPNGNYYLSWNYDDNLNFRTYLHYYDKNGNKLWENPLLVSDNKTKTWISDYSLLSDQENCAVVVFQDIRDLDDDSKESNVFAYRISPGMEFLWGNDGINLSPYDTLFTASPVVCETQDGNFIVSWFAAEEVFTDTIPGKCMVYATKLNKAGTVLWENPVVLKDTLWQYFFPTVIPSGNDDFILSWLQFEKMIDTTEGKLNWIYIYAQKYDSDGNPVWISNTAVYDEKGIETGTYLIPEVKSDGNDGAVCVWRVGKDLVTINVRTQILTKDGIEKWTHNGINVCADEYIHQDYPAFEYHPLTKNLYVFWITSSYNEQEQQLFTGLNGNLINDNGERIWADNGIEIVPPVINIEPNPMLESVRLNNNKEVIVLYSMSNKMKAQLPGTHIIKATLIDESGQYVWNEEHINVCSNTNFKTNPVLSEFGNEQWVAAWGDSRNTMLDFHQDIYGQNINFDGTIGVKGASVDEKNSTDFILSPNPATDFIDIILERCPTLSKCLTSAVNEIKIYNAFGETVKTDVQHLGDFGHLKRIDISHLTDGLYFIQIGNYSEKFVVVR